MHFSHAILVTGSRTWTDRDAMRDVFNQQWAQWEAESSVNP